MNGAERESGERGAGDVTGAGARESAGSPGFSPFSFSPVPIHHLSGGSLRGCQEKCTQLREQKRGGKRKREERKKNFQLGQMCVCGRGVQQEKEKEFENPKSALHHMEESLPLLPPSLQYIAVYRS